MGRELKRVPLDFEWPLNKKWQGYLNPYYAAETCHACNGSGYAPEALRLKNKWYGDEEPFRPEERGSKLFTADHPRIRELAERNARPDPELRWPGCNVDNEARRLAQHFNRGWSHHLNADDVAALIERGRLKDFTHTWTPETGWIKREPEVMPTPEQVNEWSLGGLCHDAINQHICVQAECKRLGVSETCPHCDGHGDVWPSEEAKARYEAWEREEPPAGPGYQIWETVSEGSPISPVFSTPEDLARHMATTKWGADHGTPYEQWLKFINGPGWAPTGVVLDGVYMDGVQAA